jgi:hypothetical protein
MGGEEEEDRQAPLLSSSSSPDDHQEEPRKRTGNLRKYLHSFFKPFSPICFDHHEQKQTNDS